MYRLLCRLVGIGLLFALTPQQSYASFRLGIDDARHLLSRTGYGYRLQDVQRFADKSLTEAVDELVNITDLRPSQPYPKWLKTRPMPIRELRALDIINKRKLRKERLDKKEALKAWWVREVQQTKAPLYEKMVMFWYKHFGVGIQNLPNIYGFYRHQLILRQEALGNYRTLMKKMLKDVAFLHFYKNTKNFKINPDSRLSKALLKKIVLGLESPPMNDVRALTQALSGASIDPATGFYRYYESLHDERNKTLFDIEYGNLQPDDVADALLDHPLAATHLAEQLWKFFISPVPERDATEQLASSLRASDYNMKVAMRDLLSLPAFWREKYRGELMKSPVELLVGVEKLFDEDMFSDQTTVKMASLLGEDIYNPNPSSHEDQGIEWLDSKSYALRQQWMQQLATGLESSMVVDLTPDSNTRVLRWASRNGILETYLLPIEPVTEAPPKETSHQMFSRIINDPTYQLK